jgi:hypothetical protein
MRKVDCAPWNDTDAVKKKIENQLGKLAAHFNDPDNVPLPAPPFPEALYKRFRDYLLLGFHNKCAYCEISITGQGKGDVEHFWPKGEVQDERGQPVFLNNGRPHPGYWWLAFEWGNLLPACRDCNNAPNKGTRFPVEGPRSEVPPATDAPLLINPLFRDPQRHLRWNVTSGKVIGRDAWGRRTVEVLRFTERTSLQELRQEQRENARSMTRRFFDRNLSAAAMSEARVFIDSVKSGKRQFSAYLLAVIADEIAFQKRQARKLEDLTGAIGREGT